MLEEYLHAMAIMLSFRAIAVGGPRLSGFYHLLADMTGHRCLWDYYSGVSVAFTHRGGECLPCTDSCSSEMLLDLPAVVIHPFEDWSGAILILSHPD